MMEMEKALDEEHHQESSQHPTRDPIDRWPVIQGVWKQVQDADSQHEARDKTRRHLHFGVRKPQE
jgi:hypothetical protein